MNWRKAGALIGAIALIDIGSRVGLMGVDRVALHRFLNDSGGSGGLLGLYAFIAGGGLYRAGVMALGIMPYLSARIFMRLARIVSPRIAALDFDERIIRTRWLTGALAAVQSLGFATFLQRTPNVVANPGFGFMATTVLTLTGASLIAMWFGEKLTESDEPEMLEMPELSAPLASPSASPALLEPALPASPLLHPRPASDAENVRMRQ